MFYKKGYFALDNKNVSSSLDSIQFLTALAIKLPLDLERKWVENTVQISKRMDILLHLRILPFLYNKLA